MDLLTSNKKWVSWAMLGAVVAIFLASLLIGTHVAGDAEEPFGGTDAAATKAAEEAGAEPWFTPIFEPAGEVESGLFAIQAAIGAGVLGYALGRMGGRRAALAELKRGSDGDDDAAGASVEADVSVVDAADSSVSAPAASSASGGKTLSR